MDVIERTTLDRGNENAHLVAINDRLGYVAHEATTVYQAS